MSVLRGLARVGSAAVDVRSQEVTRAWATSSLRPAVLEGATKLQEAVAAAIQQPQTLQVGYLLLCVQVWGWGGSC